MLKLRCGFTVEDTAVIHLLGTLILGTVVHKTLNLDLEKGHSCALYLEQVKLRVRYNPQHTYFEGSSMT